MPSYSAADNGGYAFFELRSSKALVAACAVMSVFTDTFLYGVVVPVFPFSLHDRSGVPKEEVQSVINLLVGICGAGVLLGSPFCGWISEVAPTRRLPLLLGFIFLLLSTAMLRWGTEIWVLVIGRFFTGIAGSLTWTVGQSLLVDRVDESESGRYIAIMSLGGHIGMFAGPLLGGYVYASAGYHAVFDMAIGILIFDIILRSVIIEPKVLKAVSTARDSRASIKPSEILDTERTPLLPNDGALAEAAFSSSIGAESVSSTITAAAEASSRSSFLIVDILLRCPRFLTACSSMFINSSLFNGLEATLPLFTAEEFGYGPAQTASLFVAIIAPALSGPFWGWLRDRTNAPQLLITVGFCLVVPVLVGMAFVQSNPSSGTSTIAAMANMFNQVLDADAQRRVGALVTLLVAYGATGALRSASVTTEFATSVRDLEREGKLRAGGEGVGMSFSICGIMYAGGSLAGPFLGGTIKDIWGWRYMCYAMAATALLGAILNGIDMKRKISGLDESESESEAGAE